MCIVSFAKDKEKFILTFNRDELAGRVSEKPEWRLFNGVKVFCPLDLEAGGTWIGYNKSILACIQNGALIKHVRKPPYRKSRGLILKEILYDKDYIHLISEENFQNIEPFTLSIFDFVQMRLNIYRYNGNALSNEEHKNPCLSFILTSSPLYNNIAYKAIEKEFNETAPDAESIFRFHNEHRIGTDKNRYTNLVSTVSITQFEIENEQFNCHYFDTLVNEHYYYKG